MRVLIFIFIFSSKILACALCASYTPTTLVNFDFKLDNDKITKVQIQWEFSKEFSDVLMQNYDQNYNDKFDDNELEEIRFALFDYIVPRKHLTHLQSFDDEKTQNLKTQITQGAFYIKDSKLYYDYEIAFELILTHLNTFNLKIEDKEDYFKFKFNNPNFIKLNDDFYLSTNTNSNLVFFQILKGQIPEEQSLNTQDLTPKNPSFIQKLQNLNDKTFKFIKKLLKEENSFINLALLVCISFFYGVFHASAPGHAKTLVGSYFLTHKSSYIKIVYFSLKIALIHILSAFLIVSFSLFALKAFSDFLNSDTNYLITKFSSLVIIILALFMLSKKILHNNCSCHKCQNSKINEWGVIFSAAIIPCPGTILLFVFAYEFSFFYASISALFMSLGMALVLFIFAILAHKIHKNISNERLRVFLEYLGIIFMLLFGLFIFINTKAGVF